MSRFGTKIWPPTKSWKRSILWAISAGFVLQIATPAVLQVIGWQRAALYSMLPGLWPILWATGDWFAGITRIGYLLMYSVNTVAYSALLLIALRSCARLKRQDT